MILPPALCHLIGDYLLQTDHMASEKTKHPEIAALHAATYTLPFLLVTRDPRRLLLIGATHWLVDRFRLARPLVWAKNQATWVAHYRYRYDEAGWHGYRTDKPEWLAGWLLILADNTIHLVTNHLILRGANK